MNCAAAYLDAATVNDRTAANAIPRANVLELLELLLLLPPLRPPCAASSTIPSLLRSWLHLMLKSSGPALPPAVASHNETTSQDGSELEFRIGLAAARLAKKQAELLTIKPPEILSEFFTLCNLASSRQRACLAIMLQNSIFAVAASQHQEFRESLLKLPDLSVSALDISYSMMINESFAVEFLDSLLNTKS